MRVPAVQAQLVLVLVLVAARSRTAAASGAATASDVPGGGRDLRSLLDRVQSSAKPFADRPLLRDLDRHLGRHLLHGSPSHGPIALARPVLQRFLTRTASGSPRFPSGLFIGGSNRSLTRVQSLQDPRPASEISHLITDLLNRLSDRTDHDENKYSRTVATDHKEAHAAGDKAEDEVNEDHNDEDEVIQLAAVLLCLLWKNGAEGRGDRAEAVPPHLYTLLQWTFPKRITSLQPFVLAVIDAAPEDSLSVDVLQAFLARSGLYDTSTGPVPPEVVAVWVALQRRSRLQNLVYLSERLRSQLRPEIWARLFVDVKIRDLDRKLRYSRVMGGAEPLLNDGLKDNEFQAFIAVFMSRSFSSEPLIRSLWRRELNLNEMNLFRSISIAFMLFDIVFKDSVSKVRTASSYSLVVQFF